MQALRSAYRWWAAIVFLAVVVQVALAGYGAFNAVDKAEDRGSVDSDAVEDGFGPHAALGYLIALATLVLVLLALGSRWDRRRTLWTAALFGLLVLQVVLAWIASSVAGLGVLHAANALAIFGLSGWLVAAAWRAPAEELPRGVTPPAA
ncbi:MAG: hypothetical protein ICV64_12075 [Thermoleophilia bacterium]|nr:hypothetical protein [Thermoleophilia bacterium]